MKKRFILVFLSIIAIVAVGCILCGCGILDGLFGGGGDDDTDKTDDTDKKPETVTVKYDLEDAVISVRPAASFNYTGSAIEPNVQVRSRNSTDYIFILTKENDNDDVAISYSDNVTVGTATVTVTAREGSEKYKGSQSTTFEIVQGAGYISEYAALEAALNDENYREVNFMDDLTIGEEQTLTIGSDRKLKVNGILTVNGTLVNNGLLTLTLNAYNNGVIENNASIVISDGNNLIDYADIVMGADATFSGGTILTHESSALVADETSSNKVYKRVHISEAGITPMYSERDYNGREQNVNVDIPQGSGLDKNSVTLTYQDNINAGTAHIFVKTYEQSHLYYGTADLTFTIKKVPVTVTYSYYAHTDFAALAANPNYSEIQLKSDSGGISFSDGFTVSNGCNLKIISRASFSAYCEDVVVEEGGTLTFTAIAGISNKLINNGTVNFEGSCYLHDDATVENTGSMTFNDLTYIDGALSNSGTVVVGEHSVVYASVDPVGPITNRGRLHVNSDAVSITTDGGTTVIRQRITPELIHFSSDKFSYDATAKIPTLTFGAVPVTELDSAYSVTYMYAGEYLSTVEPVKAGKINATVYFNRDAYGFYGTATAQYEIERGETTVTSSYSLISALFDPNYKKVVTSGTFTVSDAAEIGSDHEVEISAGSTLINACTLTVKGKLTVLGAYINAKSVDAEGSLAVSGGAVVNNGEMVFNDTATEFPGSGTTYARKPLTDSSFSATQVNDIYYRGTRTRVNYGDFTISFNGDVLDTSEYEFSSLTFWDARNNNSFFVIAKDTARTVYGESASITVPVLRSVVEVYTIAELERALNDTTNSGTLCNYEKIVVMDDLTKEIPSRNSVEYTLLNGTELDFRGHKLNVVKTSVSSYGLTFNLNGEMLIDHQDWSTIINFVVGSNGNIALYMSSDMAPGLWNNLHTYVTKVVLTEDILSAPVSNPVIRSTSTHTFTFDLNGHTLNFMVTLYADFADVVFISSAEAYGILAQGARFNSSSPKKLYMQHLDFACTDFASGNASIHVEDCLFAAS